jgi:pimeloyl-ACP methyl ester carboxylesterase
MLKLGEVELELHESGTGAPLLFLHSGAGFSPDDAFVGLLAERHRVVAPSHPGFGCSSLPDWIDSIDDIAHIYLELIDRLELKRVTLVGASIGGWIAAEMATKSPERFGKVTLIGPVGVKTGGPKQLDIPDIFAHPVETLDRMRFHDPAKAKIDLTKLSEEQMRVIARNNETLALLVWEPYMHNPKLKHRLHRMTMPVLFSRVSRPLRETRPRRAHRDHRGSRPSAAYRAAERFRHDARRFPRPRSLIHARLAFQRERLSFLAAAR